MLLLYVLYILYMYNRVSLMFLCRKPMYFRRWIINTNIPPEPVYILLFCFVLMLNITIIIRKKNICSSINDKKRKSKEIFIHIVYYTTQYTLHTQHSIFSNGNIFVFLVNAIQYCTSASALLCLPCYICALSLRVNINSLVCCVYVFVWISNNFFYYYYS